MINASMRSKKERDIPFADALALLDEQAGDDMALQDTVAILRSVNDAGVFDGVPFDSVWSLLQAIAKSAD